MAILSIILSVLQATPLELPRATPTNDPLRWVRAKDYPRAALRADQEGRVGFIVYVTPKGRAADCRITASSGSPLLDAATCPSILKRARFAKRPAMPGSRFSGQYARYVMWLVQERYSFPPLAPRVPAAPPAPPAPPPPPRPWT